MCDSSRVCEQYLRVYHICCEFITNKRSKHFALMWRPIFHLSEETQNCFQRIIRSSLGRKLTSTWTGNKTYQNGRKNSGGLSTYNVNCTSFREVSQTAPRALSKVIGPHSIHLHLWAPVYPTLDAILCFCESENMSAESERPLQHHFGMHLEKPLRTECSIQFVAVSLDFHIPHWKVKQARTWRQNLLTVFWAAGSAVE